MNGRMTIDELMVQVGQDLGMSVMFAIALGAGLVIMVRTAMALSGMIGRRSRQRRLRTKRADYELFRGNR